MSAPALRAPVALFVFNRPELTERVLAAIAAARPGRLLVVADGPRPERSGEDELVAATRAVIDLVDWDCEVSTDYADTNLGCKHRVASGIDWVFEQAEEAILLEDDCLPDPTFFRFCDELLECYRDDERVHMITGANLLGGQRLTRDSYYFSRWYHIWGWATWRRAWQHYDIEMRRWPELRESGWLEDHAGGRVQAKVVRAMFDGAYDGRVDTWDFQWVFSGWLRDAMAVKPATNLVTNIGYGELASHEKSADHPASNVPTEPLTFPVRHPEQVALLDAADRAEFDRLNPGARDSKPGAGGPNVVMGAAIGLHPDQIRPMLSSLRNTGYAGDVVLFVDPALRRALGRDRLAEGVTLLTARQWLPFKLNLLSHRRVMRLLWTPAQNALWHLLQLIRRLPFPPPVRRALEEPLAAAVFTPMDSRFLRYASYLRRHPHERVLLVDVRDLLFQSEPFASLPSSGLGVSIETDSYTVASEPHNAEWVTRVYGTEMLDRIGHNRVSCVGVTCGDAAAMIAYLEQFADELLALSPQAAGIGGADTAIHNMLVWTGRLGSLHPLEPLMSPVATLNAVAPEEIRLSETGRLLNRDGSEPSVLHQYDRVAAIRDPLRQTLCS